MEPSNPSIVELLDEAGKPLCAVIKRDGEVGGMLSILLISWWAFCKPIIFVIHPLLKYCKLGFKPLDLLPMDIISNLNGVSKS